MIRKERKAFAMELLEMADDYERFANLANVEQAKIDFLKNARMLRRQAESLGFPYNDKSEQNEIQDMAEDGYSRAIDAFKKETGE